MEGTAGSSGGCRYRSALSGTAELVWKRHRVGGGTEAGDAANALTKRLNVKAGVLAQQYHILYQNEHCRTGSKITLTLQQDTGDDRDGSDDTTKGSLVPQSIVTASQSSQEKEDMYGKDKNITDFAESIGA